MKRTLQHCFKRRNQQNNRGNGYRRDRANVNYFDNESVEEETIATASNEAIATLGEADFAPFTGKDLIVKKGHLDDRAVNIMLDSGATSNVVKPGLLQRFLSEMAIQVTRFDGTNTNNKKVKKGVANISLMVINFLTFRSLSGQ